jgi:hypothetical protein
MLVLLVAFSGYTKFEEDDIILLLLLVLIGGKIIVLIFIFCFIYIELRNKSYFVQFFYLKIKIILYNNV